MRIALSSAVRDVTHSDGQFTVTHGDQVSTAPSLVIATGAGSEMRRAVGAAVFFGMMGVTIFGLLFTPVFYLAIRRLVGPKRSALREMARQAR